jgi:uncharacterized protein YqhQ
LAGQAGPAVARWSHPEGTRSGHSAPHRSAVSLPERSLPLPRYGETLVKNVQRNSRIDARLGIYLIALVMIVIVLGYWIVVANR